MTAAFHPSEPFQTLTPEPDLISHSSNCTMSVKEDNFDPAKHLSFQMPNQVYTMQDLNLPNDIGVSPAAVSEPFQLFTEAAVERMRQEIFDPKVMENYKASCNINKSMLRGYAAKAAPFIYDTWKNPEVLSIVSKVAGIELVPVMDFEIAHVNLAISTEDETAEESKTLVDRKFTADDEKTEISPSDDDKPLVGWHTDSYPFVCVTMLSDCTTMVGGETALHTGDGTILKVRGPAMGCAVIMQGRYIEHMAMRAFGTTERITSVTSFRPKCASYKDDTVLTTVRPISDLSELYMQFSEYRLEILEKRIQQQLKSLKESMRAGKKFDTQSVKVFLKEQENFLAHTNQELVIDDLVSKGYIEEIEVPVDPGSNKRRRAE